MLLLELWEREKKSCSFSKVYSMRHVLNVLLFYLGYLIKVIEKYFQGVGNIIHSGNDFTVGKETMGHQFLYLPISEMDLDMVHKLNKSWFFINDAIYLDSFPRLFCSQPNSPIPAISVF